MIRVRRDSDGFTLIEVLIVVVVIGLIAVVLAAATSVILRTSPTTQFRIDDARATRGMQTWLSHDVMSAPAVAGLTPQGGYVTAPSASICGGGGSNIVIIEWVEDDGSTTRYAANYRLDGDDIIRHSCRDTGAGHVSTGSSRITGGVSSTPCATGWTDPYARLTVGTNTAGEDIAELETCFTVLETDTGLNAGGGSSSEVLLRVSSRNPSEFLP